MDKEEKIKCSKCGKFVKCKAYLSESSSEMIECECKCGNKWSEGY